MNASDRDGAVQTLTVSPATPGVGPCDSPDGPCIEVVTAIVTIEDGDIRGPIRTPSCTRHVNKFVSTVRSLYPAAVIVDER